MKKPQENNQKTNQPLQKRNFSIDILFILFIFSFTLAIYIKTLSHSVYFGDSGEFITAAATLGIAHPPGYPLYTMLAHLFTYLPFGTLPFKVNLFSAVTSSLTLVFVYLSVLKLTGNRLAALGGSLFLAFSYLFWLYSLVAEVFSLNNLFISIIIFLSILIFKNPNDKKLFYILSFVFGLALTNHHTILFLTPSLLFLILTTNPKNLLNPKFIILASLFFILGLLPYLYLPIRASQNPILNWGDPDTLGRFFNHVLRRDYGTFSLSPGARGELNLNTLFFYTTSLFKQFVWIGGILGLIGLTFVFLANKKIFFFLLLAFFFLGLVFIIMTRTPIDNILVKAAIERFFIASHVIFSLWICLGIVAISNFLPKILKPAAILVPFLFIIPLFFDFSKVDQSKNFLYEEYGKKIFESLPQNSFFITFGDKGTMISRYLQIAQGLRPDITVANFHFIPDKPYQANLKQRHPNLSFPWDKFAPGKLSSIEAAKIICQEVVPKYPTFIENLNTAFSPQDNKDCSYHPFGGLISLDVKEKQKNITELTNEDKTFWQPLQKTLEKIQVPDLRTKVVLAGYADAKAFLGIMFSDLGELKLAEKAYHDAHQISPDSSIGPRLLAKMYFEKGQYNDAILWGERSIEADRIVASEPYKWIGVAYLKGKNDKEKATYYFQKYLSLTGGSPTEKAGLEQLIKEFETEPTRSN